MNHFTDGRIIAGSDRAEDLEQPILRDFHRYWLDRRGARRWPARADIDPLDLKPLLGNIALLDVVHEPDVAAPPRFRYRVFGTGFVEWFGFDMTGRMIDDWPAPEYRAVMNASYREVAAAGRPFRRLRSFVKDNRILRYEALMLPLGIDSGDSAAQRVGQIIVAQVFTA
ncbi:PAS domain-containing protein [Ferrovibrio terrae]|uniref:PAS domain-containing protein n=1 Tax=Ferrovibrio terrae TaxID=2594003 RepID=UPI003137C961